MNTSMRGEAIATSREFRTSLPKQATNLATMSLSSRGRLGNDMPFLGNCGIWEGASKVAKTMWVQCGKVDKHDSIAKGVLRLYKGCMEKVLCLRRRWALL